MAWEILTTADYPAVLAALDTLLTSAQVPDSLLDLPIYSEAAIQDVYDAYSAAGSAANPANETNAANQTRITRAAIYYCAARLAPAVVRITSLQITTRDGSYSRQVFDPAKRAAELQAMAAEELADILEPSEETPNRPTVFALARGYRGR